MNKNTAYLFCVNCTDIVSSKKGSFVYHKGKPFTAVSPVFECCDELFKWMHKRGMTTGVLADFAVYDTEEGELIRRSMLDSGTL